MLYAAASEFCILFLYFFHLHNYISVGTCPNNLKFVYENDEKFSVFPTFAVVPGLTASGQLISQTEIPGVTVDLTRVTLIYFQLEERTKFRCGFFFQLLHGEQYMQFFKPFPTSGTVYSEAKLADVLDKGSGAALLVEGTWLICFFFLV